MKKMDMETYVKIRNRIETYYPPGYAYRQEWIGACLLLGMGVVLSFRFFSELNDARRMLYSYDDGWRTLAEGAVAEPFAQLTKGYPAFFVPLFLYLAFMAWYHYFYYCYGMGTKSIYLMRRLPKRSPLIRSCIQGTLLCMAAAAVSAAALYLLYYLIYLLTIPAECLPRLV